MKVANERQPPMTRRQSRCMRSNTFLSVFDQEQENNGYEENKE